jgi:hypothetical protein
MMFYRFLTDTGKPSGSMSMKVDGTAPKKFYLSPLAAAESDNYLGAPLVMRKGDLLTLRLHDNFSTLLSHTLIACGFIESAKDS